VSNEKRLLCVYNFFFFLSFRPIKEEIENFGTSIPLLLLLELVVSKEEFFYCEVCLRIGGNNT
jgi:hypothetical protein